MHQQLKMKPKFPLGTPFFYGYIILIAGTLGMLASIPGQTMGVSVFTDHLIESLKISRIYLSTAYMTGTIISALLLSAAGRFFDRHGARVTGVLASVGLGLTLGALSQMDRITGFASAVLPFIPYTVLVLILMSVSFLCLRFFGQGVLTLVSRNMVMKWFDVKRGRINALMGVFVSFGFSIAPLFLNSLIDRGSWQGAWLSLSLLTGAGFTLIAFLFFRDNPEDCGMVPDGGPAASHSSGSFTVENEKRQYTLKEAQNEPLFWIIVFSLTLWSLIGTAFTFHVISIFEKAGMQKETALAIFLPVSVISVFSGFAANWLSDKISLKIILNIYIVTTLLMCVPLLRFGNGIPVWIYIAGGGLSGGLFTVISAVAYPKLYGRKHLGAISGYGTGWLVAGSAVGPSLFSLSEKVTGSYAVSALLCTVMLCILLLLSMLSVRKRAF